MYLCCNTIMMSWWPESSNVSQLWSLNCNQLYGQFPFVVFVALLWLMLFYHTKLLFWGTAADAKRNLNVFYINCDSGLVNIHRSFMGWNPILLKIFSFPFFPCVLTYTIAEPWTAPSGLERSVYSVAHCQNAEKL